MCFGSTEGGANADLEGACTHFLGVTKITLDGRRATRVSDVSDLPAIGPHVVLDWVLTADKKVNTTIVVQRTNPTVPTTQWRYRGTIRSRLRPPVRLLSRLIGLAVATILAVSPVRADETSTTVLAAGDIAFCERSFFRQLSDWFRGYSGQPGAPATAALLDRLPGPILVLGDLAYWEGTAEEFNDCYDRSWGRHKARSYPVAGNHEYRSPEAAPYFDYWGERTGEDGKGYYSFDLDAWHIIALNSNIPAGPGSEQEVWLRRDLAATEADCILAYWHHPRFSSGRNRDQLETQALYRALYEAGASVVLAGHDHNYERFAPMDPEGKLDPDRGLRSFVVGTGGGQLKPATIQDPPRQNSEVVNGTTWGVLHLTLFAEAYAWQFIPVDGQSFEDSGRASCVERKPVR